MDNAHRFFYCQYQVIEKSFHPLTVSQGISLTPGVNMYSFSLTSLAECLILHRLQNRELYHGLSIGTLLCFPPQLSQRIRLAA